MLKISSVIFFSLFILSACSANPAQNGLSGAAIGCVVTIWAGCIPGALAGGAIGVVTAPINAHPSYP